MNRKRHAEVRRLLDLALSDTGSVETASILEQAMDVAIDITHELGAPDETDQAIVETFLHACTWACRHAIVFQPTEQEPSDPQ